MLKIISGQFPVEYDDLEWWPRKTLIKYGFIKDLPEPGRDEIKSFQQCLEKTIVGLVARRLYLPRIKAEIERLEKADRYCLVEKQELENVENEIGERESYIEWLKHFHCWEARQKHFQETQQGQAVDYDQIIQDAEQKVHSTIVKWPTRSPPPRRLKHLRILHFLQDELRRDETYRPGELPDERLISMINQHEAILKNLPHDDE